MSEPQRVSRHRDANEQLLYFTTSSFLDGGNTLVFLSDRTGDPNLFALDLRSGEERQISFNAAGHLKSYAYFDGQVGKGLGKASPCVHAESRTVFWIEGFEVRARRLDGDPRVLTRLPESLLTAYTHASADGRRLAVPTVDARALKGPLTAEGNPRGVDERMRREGLASYIRVHDTSRGDLLSCVRVPLAWVTHAASDPRDPDRILYNHEWCADPGVRRMWLWDGSRHRALRTVSEPGDWVCHETWAPDGSYVLYHGKTGGWGREGGGPFLGRWTETDGCRETPLAANFTRYGHFVPGPDGRIVTDGYYETPQDQPSERGQWISLLRVDWRERRIDWTPLCRHGSSWRTQDDHPHPVFDPSGAHVFFTSDRDGRRAVWKIPSPPPP